MDAWILAWRVIYAASRRRGAMVVEVLMLPHLARLSAAVLSVPVVMCSSGSMSGAKRWRWVIYAARSRSLIYLRNFIGDNFVLYGGAEY